MTVRRPTRSDQLPPTNDDVDLTTWRAAQASGNQRGPLRPTSVSRSRRKASVELPSVNNASTSRNRRSGARQRLARRRRRSRLGAARPAGGASRVRLSRTNRIRTTAIGARNDREREQRAVLIRIEQQEERRERGTEDGAGVIHRAVEAEDAAARFGRRKAASSASRGAPRMPFPTRSMNRTANTCGHDWARAMSGRTADDRA